MADEKKESGDESANEAEGARNSEHRREGATPPTVDPEVITTADDAEEPPD